jgi:hypothetical protein
MARLELQSDKELRGVSRISDGRHEETSHTITFGLNATIMQCIHAELIHLMLSISVDCRRRQGCSHFGSHSEGGVNYLAKGGTSSSALFETQARSLSGQGSTEPGQSQIQKTTAEDTLGPASCAHGNYARGLRTKILCVHWWPPSNCSSIARITSLRVRHML